MTPERRKFQAILCIIAARAIFTVIGVRRDTRLIEMNRAIVMAAMLSVNSYMITAGLTDGVSLQRQEERHETR
jgi:hypothetical protein